MMTMQWGLTTAALAAGFAVAGLYDIWKNR
jgi:hypothetical protein